LTAQHVSSNIIAHHLELLTVIIAVMAEWGLSSHSAMAAVDNDKHV